MKGVWMFEIQDRLLSDLQIGVLAFLFTNAAFIDLVYARVMARDSTDDGLCLMGVSIAMSVLQIIFVVLRFYTRRCLQREKYSSDDWVMLIALVGILVPYYGATWLIFYSRLGALQRLAFIFPVSIERT